MVNIPISIQKLTGSGVTAENRILKYLKGKQFAYTGAELSKILNIKRNTISASISKIRKRDKGLKKKQYDGKLYYYYQKAPVKKLKSKKKKGLLR